MKEANCDCDDWMICWDTELADRPSLCCGPFLGGDKFIIKTCIMDVVSFCFYCDFLAADIPWISCGIEHCGHGFRA